MFHKLCSTSFFFFFFFKTRPAMWRLIKWNEELKLISRNEYYKEIKKVSPKIAGLDANVIILNFSPSSSSNTLTWPFWQTNQKPSLRIHGIQCSFRAAISLACCTIRVIWKGGCLDGGGGTWSRSPTHFSRQCRIPNFCHLYPECRFLFQWPFSH